MRKGKAGARHRRRGVRLLGIESIRCGAVLIPSLVLALSIVASNASLVAGEMVRPSVNGAQTQSLSSVFSGRSELQNPSQTATAPVMGARWAPARSIPLSRAVSQSTAEIGLGSRFPMDALQQQGMTIDDAPPPARPPGVAFLLSALLPGAGQLYNGNRRAYAYLGIEAAAWFTRFSYLDAGNQKEGSFESFARRHWSYDRFHESASGDGCPWTEESDSLILVLEQEDPDQYYEELSKTDTYRCGWDDFDPTNPETLSPRRADYRDQRQEANDLKGRANLAIGVLVVNRVVSAVDAFRTARSRQGTTPRLRLESRLEGSFLQPRATIGIVKELP